MSDPSAEPEGRDGDERRFAATVRRRRPRWSEHAWLTVSVVLHGSFVLACGLMPSEERGLSLDAIDDHARVVRYLLSDVPAAAEETPEFLSPSAPRASLRHGTTTARYGIDGSASDASRAGVLGVISRDSATGSASHVALGALMGDQIGTSYGFGGLGPAGAGRGGGGSGDGTIGLGQLGTIGHGGGVPGRARAGAGGAFGHGPTRPLGVPPLATQGVLQSSFVAGQGASTRLDALLRQGVAVDGRDVRLEAFAERGRVPYPVPSDRSVALYAELERARLSTSRDRVHLAVTLVAQLGEAPPRPHMDVRLVVDCSGSMSGDKFADAEQAATELVHRLRPDDVLGVIAFSDGAREVVAPARVGDGRAALAALQQLEAGGGTNIQAALELAQRIPPRRTHASDVALVMLLSDGEATNGITDPASLAAIARGAFDRGGVITTTIGVGTDFSEDTMVSIARESGGSYDFVGDPADVPRILTDELEQRALSVAQGLRVRVTLGHGVELAKLYGTRLLSGEEHAAVRASEVATDTRLARELGITRDRTAERDEGLRMHLPTFRRGDEHVILLELDVPAGTSTTDIARVALDYKDVVRGQNGHEEVQVRAERSTDTERVAASLVRPVKRVVLAFEGGLALQEAAEALSTGDAGRAVQALGERRALLEQAASVWRDPELARDASLLGRYERLAARTVDPQPLVLAFNFWGDRRMR